MAPWPARLGTGYEIPSNLDMSPQYFRINIIPFALVFYDGKVTHLVDN